MFRKRLQFETLEDRRVCALVFGDGAANLELGKQFPYVGWLETTKFDAEDETRFGGSGVLIKPNWVLMSAHQAFNIDNDFTTMYSSFRIGFGSNFLTDRGEHQIASEIIVNPTYTAVAKGYCIATIKNPQFRPSATIRIPHA